MWRPLENHVVERSMNPLVKQRSIINFREVTIKPKTLTSRNFDEFGELGSSRQTSKFQSKATKQNKRLQIVNYLKMLHK